jgi:hypothetical protein
MAASIRKRALALVVLLTFCWAPAFAKDHPSDRDWSTGVTVAPGAMTWSSDNYNDKKQLINETAAAQGKACSDNYTFLGWPPGSGGAEVIMQGTRKNYETAGYSVTQKQGHVSTDTIWTVAKEGREAVVLWGAVAGSTIYLSCITSGSPASDPAKPLYVGILLAAGLGTLLAGLWMIWRAARGAGTRDFSVPGLVLAITGALLSALAALLAFVA